MREKINASLHNFRKMSWDDRVFVIINGILLLIVFLALVYPIWFVIIASFSDQPAVSAGQVILLPIGFNLDGYKRVMESAEVWRGYANTILYTLVGTTLNVLITALVGYALGRKDMKGRGFIMILFVITMYFSGGMIPKYLNVRDFGLIDTRTIMIINGLVTPYNVIVCRTYFANSIPWELHESAFIDGASDFKCFKNIAMPLAKPIIAVLVIMYGVTHWNQYFQAMMYLRDKALYPLQSVLREILLKSNLAAVTGDMTQADQVMFMIREENIANALKYSLIVVSTVPILSVYPFLEKHFEKGMMIGSVKG